MTARRVNALDMSAEWFADIRPAPEGSFAKEDALRRSLTAAEDSNLMTEILDRVLDHGIVVEPYSRIRLTNLELHNTQEHLVIDWCDTYF